MSCYSRWSSRSIKSVNLGSPNSSFCFYRLLTATTQLSWTRLAFLVTKGMWLLKKKVPSPLESIPWCCQILDNLSLSEAKTSTLRGRLESPPRTARTKYHCNPPQYLSRLQKKSPTHGGATLPSRFGETGSSDSMQQMDSPSRSLYYFISNLFGNPAHCSKI